MKNQDIDIFLLMIGSMKCGTTSLFHYLAQHPEISRCRQKEPNFFSNNNSWVRGFDYYKSLWDYDHETHKIALEASTAYTKLPRKTDVVDRIYQIKSEQKVNFKFVYIVRNPIDRIVSHCTHDLQEGWSLKYKQNIVHGIPYPAIEVSKYAMQLDAYHKRFPKEDILIITFDDLKARPQEVLKKICDFAGINSDFDFSDVSKLHNRSKGMMRTNSLWPTFDRYIASPIISYLPSGKQRRAKNAVRKFFTVEEITEKVEFSESQRNFITQELRDDLRKLTQEYGIDISRWGLGV
ncbi:sulfotransferase family protein [Adonisia turfae]|uniref:Sulfotransferase n=1 Tax=Adonisia turfae CCMR0081 TaxID=2292702 RepID=A0A6M0RK42_9CYAN|nr:sulfotransferase [Adonisia turfae]NEZ56152.1 sulfotransferase [Adonisia turfae CCMR0081]